MESLQLKWEATMLNIQEIHGIHDQLADPTVSKAAGRTGLTLLAMGMSAVPLAGGLLSYACDQLRSKLYDPNFAGPIRSLATAIEELAPEIEKIEDLDARVKAIEKLGYDQAVAASTIRELVELMSSSGLDPLLIASNGGTTNFVNNVVRQMHLHSVALNGGETNINGIDATGSAAFDTRKGSVQNIENSTFSGRSENIQTKATVGRAAIHPGAKLEFNPHGQSTAAKVTITPDGNGEIDGMTIGPNGVEFGKRR